MKTDSKGDCLCFAQLSDPHLSALGDVKIRDLMGKRLLGYLSWYHKRRKDHRGEVLAALLSDLRCARPEHVVVTGDLTNIGLPEEFRQVRLWLETLGPGSGVTVIPGNHDAYARRRWDRSFSMWAPFMTSDAGGPESRAKRLGVRFPILRVRGPVAFIGLSSARPSAPFLAIGSLGEEQLERTARLLRETGRRGLFRVVLVHHPPRAGAEKWRKRLTDADRLCATIFEHGAELVLHGHRHRAVRSTLAGPAGPIPVFGIPSASYAGHRPERRAGYNLYRVARTEGSWELGVTVRGYLAARNGFYREHEHLLHLPQAVQSPLENRCPI